MKSISYYCYMSIFQLLCWNQYMAISISASSFKSGFLTLKLVGKLILSAEMTCVDRNLSFCLSEESGMGYERKFLFFLKFVQKCTK